MIIHNITWRGESIDDIELLKELPENLRQVLTEVNGFSVHDGALHVRGASSAPEWHSLRAAWHGPNALHVLYKGIVLSSEIPFAQEQCGDQFLLQKRGTIVRLFAETGEIELIAGSLDEFFAKVNEDIAGFLNIGLRHKLQPGELLLAFPPFCVERSGQAASIRPTPAREVIHFHADLAGKIREVPDGGKIVFKVAH